MYSGCGGYGWSVNVGGDRCVTGTYASASGGGPRVAASGAGEECRTDSGDDAGTARAPCP